MSLCEASAFTENSRSPVLTTRSSWPSAWHRAFQSSSREPPRTPATTSSPASLALSSSHSKPHLPCSLSPGRSSVTSNLASSGQLWASSAAAAASARPEQSLASPAMPAAAAGLLTFRCSRSSDLMIARALSKLRSPLTETTVSPGCSMSSFRPSARQAAFQRPTGDSSATRANTRRPRQRASSLHLKPQGCGLAPAGRRSSTASKTPVSSRYQKLRGKRPASGRERKGSTAAPSLSSARTSLLVRPAAFMLAFSSAAQPLACSMTKIGL
mmetsp:Transcript_74732/g.236195  ORF Transcript_74732/g.236195 Transcript_74732/m.236195 type:complete len:270 (-) Transcript_74732:131-940(-)